ncbi:MAG: tRNA pseudouridine(38-40) synthase TruA [Nitrospirae bacterium]|nr:tRNA pseudouridine(38-40) synthase TruA [Nitrospirota bacterium]MBI3595297.1 tRNA pseudouridine(38-40) synthase TruA [Nitrospirota bacterium]
MPNIKLTIAYDGSRYHGWQTQPNVVTIQEVLTHAIETITGGEKIRLTGAGRTDAGVHAIGQAANFNSEKLLSEKKWKTALNALLPYDVSVNQVEIVPKAFHARYSARRKSYIYLIGKDRSPFLFKREWTIFYPLNLVSMRRALNDLIGQHDFTSFASSLSESDSKICHLFKGEILREKDSIRIRLTADRFLTHMVRTVVGTLVEVGTGKRKPGEIKTILAARDRTLAGKTAPPYALYLEKVIYPKEFS